MSAGAGAGRLLERLEGVKEAGPDKWIALCPCHGDKRPSLSVDRGDGAAMLYCHACGSNGADVCTELGLPTAALYDDWDESAASKRKPQKPKPTKKTPVARALAAAADAGPETLDWAVKRLCDVLRAGSVVAGRPAEVLVPPPPPSKRKTVGTVSDQGPAADSPRLRHQRRRSHRVLTSRSPRLRP